MGLRFRASFRSCTASNSRSRRLDDRIEGQRELIALAGKPVIPPSEEKFYPALESLRWREEHLVTTD